jgi:hypothetical protein
MRPEFHRRDPAGAGSDGWSSRQAKSSKGGFEGRALPLISRRSLTSNGMKATPARMSIMALLSLKANRFFSMPSLLVLPDAKHN